MVTRAKEELCQQSLYWAAKRDRSGHRRAARQGVGNRRSVEGASGAPGGARRGRCCGYRTRACRQFKPSASRRNRRPPPSWPRPKAGCMAGRCATEGIGGRREGCRAVAAAAHTGRGRATGGVDCIRSSRRDGSRRQRDLARQSAERDATQVSLRAEHARLTERWLPSERARPQRAAPRLLTSCIPTTRYVLVARAGPWRAWTATHAPSAWWRCHLRDWRGAGWGGVGILRELRANIMGGMNPLLPS